MWVPEASHGRVPQDEAVQQRVRWLTGHQGPTCSCSEGNERVPSATLPGLPSGSVRTRGCPPEREAGPAVGPERTGLSRQGPGAVVFPREPQRGGRGGGCK